ncbi:MAG: glycosyltransferase N-terminal domain-containing protein [Planctomycetota bacterium]
MGLGRDLCYAVAGVVSSPVWGWGLLRTGKWRTDWKGRFGWVPRSETVGFEGEQGGKTLLIHGVSVGEVNLIRPMVERLEGVEGLRLVIAATTDTGVARAEQLYGERHRVVRYPLDFSWMVRRFLRAVKPDAVALVELEVWPNLVEQCAAGGVLVGVINGRLSERSYRGYRRIGWLVRGSFGRLWGVAAQTAEIAERFVGVGVPAERVVVLDTMKWDAARVEEPGEVAGVAEFAAEMGIDRAPGSRPLVVWGSTGPGEEVMALAGIAEDVQLLIAPRKPEWFEGVVEAARARGGGGLEVVRRTERTGVPDAAEAASPHGGKGCVLLLDTIGELRKAYALADVCVVGRSFTGKLYGSDMMEPIGLGKPTVVGPYTKDFSAVMEALRAGDGVVETDDPWGAIRGLLEDRESAGAMAERGRAVIRARQSGGGSAGRHAAWVLGMMGLKKLLSASC